MVPMSVDRVRSMWERLRRNKDDFEVIGVSKTIKASWERSEHYRVSPYLKKAPVILTHDELMERKRKNEELITCSLITMRRLFEFVAGSGFVVALTDNEGYILELIGDEEALQFAEAGNFVPGANWSENVMGTNAIGMALVEKQPVQVHGYEHYCLCAYTTTCSAAPICQPDGTLLGVLDLTGPFDRVSKHTLGLVVAAVNAIENQIALQRAYENSESEKVYKNVIPELVSEGVLVVDKFGYITYLNRTAGQLLRLDQSKSIGLNLRTLLGNKKRQNTYFYDLLQRDGEIADESVTINVAGEKIKFNISCRQIVSSSGLRSGVVVILRKDSEIKECQYTTPDYASHGFAAIIGQSSRLVPAIRLAKAAAMSASNVLLLGESGTGKELFAQAIHQAGPRSKQPFVAINCAAFPRELIASELFGYEEGAFTGARKGGNPGKFELANHGTIFLDEIGEMPLDLQAILLRVLEERKVVRLGGKTPVSVDVRVIAATNKNLRLEMEKGNFRPDLFYRLNVITIEIPSLRERKDDLELLCTHFLQQINKRLGKRVEKISPEVMEAFYCYHWPGNIRELQNVIERALQVTQGATITLNDIPQEIYGCGGNNAVSNRKPVFNVISTQRQSIKNVEKELIRHYLQQFRSKTRVAKELGIARSSLYRKLKEYCIE